MQFFHSIPMALHIWPLLCLLFPLSSSAGPLSTVSSLSPFLTALVPACAHGCLRSFVADSFPSSTCRHPFDLECVCTRDSKTGLTLGEGALRCLASACSKNSTAISKAVLVYEACSQFPNAKQMTHQTLTATHVTVKTIHSPQAHTSTMADEETDLPVFPSSINRPPPISTSAITDSPYPTGIITDTSIPSTASITTFDEPSTTTEASFTTPSTITSSIIPTTTSQSLATSTATAAAVAPAQQALTKPQIAGVTVGSIAAAGLVFGLLALVFCLRDRKKRRRGSDASFGNDKIVIDPPRTPSPPPPSVPAFEDVEYGLREVGAGQPIQTQAAIARPQSNRWSFWRKNVKPEEIGVAVAQNPLPQTTHDHPPLTPMSAASYETTSRLLPDKPTWSLYPPPLRISSYTQDVSPIDPPEPAAAGFSRALPGLIPKPVPRGHGTMGTSQPNLRTDHPALRAMPSDPFLDSTSSNRQPDPRQFQTLPAQRSRAGPRKPVSVHYGQWAGSVEIHRKPVPTRPPPDGVGADATIERRDWGLDASSQATAPAAELPVFLREPAPARRKSSNKRKLSGKRPMTFLSATSDTSFEDADSEEEPPLPQSVLSPVIESPPSHRRTAGVRYPVVPTSAAESPSINRTIREVRREQIELNPASDRSKGKAKASPRTPSPKDKPVPDVPELAGTELKERQQVPDSNSDRVKPGSAKWSILVAPGFEGIENVGSPKSKASTEWTPASTPTRRAR